MQTLTLIGTPPPRRDHRPGTLETWLPLIEREGMAAWARSTMAGRLGSGFPPQGLAWWADELMGRTATSTALGFMSTIPTWDVAADLPRIRCPTLVITTEGSALGSADAMRAWQQKIPNSTLLVLPGDSFHVAATDHERCAHAVRDFIFQVRT